MNMILKYFWLFLFLQIFDNSVFSTHKESMIIYTVVPRLFSDCLVSSLECWLYWDKMFVFVKFLFQVKWWLYAKGVPANKVHTDPSIAHQTWSVKSCWNLCRVLSWTHVPSQRCDWSVNQVDTLIWLCECHRLCKRVTQENVGRGERKWHVNCLAPACYCKFDCRAN